MDVPLPGEAAPGEQEDQGEPVTQDSTGLRFRA